MTDSGKLFHELIYKSYSKLKLFRGSWHLGWTIKLCLLVMLSSLLVGYVFISAIVGPRPIMKYSIEYSSKTKLELKIRARKARLYTFVS